MPCVLCAHFFALPQPFSMPVMVRDGTFQGENPCTYTYIYIYLDKHLKNLFFCHEFPHLTDRRLSPPGPTVRLCVHKRMYQSDTVSSTKIFTLSTIFFVRKQKLFCFLYFSLQSTTKINGNLGLLFLG